MSLYIYSGIYMMSLQIQHLLNCKISFFFQFVVKYEKETTIP